MPTWLHILALISLAAGAISLVVIFVDLLGGHRQHMAIMEVVWLVTALYAGPLALWAYFTLGRTTTHQRMRQAMEAGEGDSEEHPEAHPVGNSGGHPGAHPGAHRPMWQAVMLAASHCGAGCTLGDIVAEWLLVAAPVVAVWFGYGSLFPEKIFAAWIVDFLFAFGFGIAFQYFTIVPMRGLSFAQGIAAAVKADTLSLTSWQVGMYGFMALAHFYLFNHLLGVPLKVTSVEFWFMMQLAMLAGFVTACPVNAWLIRSGIKEKM